jgi:hypothetical protein
MAVVSSEVGNEYCKQNLMSYGACFTLIIIKREEKHVFCGRYEQHFSTN